MLFNIFLKLKKLNEILKVKSNQDGSKTDLNVDVLEIDSMNQ